MDWLWMQIVSAVHAARTGLDAAFYPLADALGPSAAVVLAALLTVAATRGFSRFKTRRYKRLKADFEYWFDVRQQALTSSNDQTKSEMLARDIDKAKLNRLYYDFFLEGLLLNILTVYLPVLVMAAYVNESFRPEVLAERFGEASLVVLPFGQGVELGAVAWYVLWLVVGFVLLSAGKRLAARRRAPAGQRPADDKGEA